MADVQHALREDPATIALLEDAGQYFKNYCQICVFERKLVHADYLGKPLAFALYGGDNSYSRRFPGEVSDLEMRMKDRNILPKDNYVAVIESEAEFQITASVLNQLSKDCMPVAGFENYMNFFSGQSSGFLLFLRVYKTDQHIPRKLWWQGSHGSRQIFDLHKPDGSLCSVHIDKMEPVISDVQFSYLKDEILHVLRTNGSLISEYQNTEKGIESLRERYLADKKLRNTLEMWHNRNGTSRFDPQDAEEDFDMAQLDYEAIFNEAESVCPSMKSMIERIRNLQPARIGEYDYFLEIIHKRGPGADEAAHRIFDMTLRSCVKTALYAYKNDGIEFEDAFQEACIGAWTAIWKHTDDILGLFPSYASMWMHQVMNRNLPYRHYSCYVPVHMKAKIEQYIMQIEMNTGTLDFEHLSEEDLFDLLMEYTDCSKKQAFQIIPLLLPQKSIDVIQEETDDSVFASNEDVESEVLTKIQDEDISRIAVSGLTKRQKFVIEQRFGLNGASTHTLEEVGQQLSVTRERVRQIEEKAKMKIVTKLYVHHIINEKQLELFRSKCNSRKQKYTYSI